MDEATKRVPTGADCDHCVHEQAPTASCPAASPIAHAVQHGTSPRTEAMTVTDAMMATLWIAHTVQHSTDPSTEAKTVKEAVKVTSSTR